MIATTEGMIAINSVEDDIDTQDQVKVGSLMMSNAIVSETAKEANDDQQIQDTNEEQKKEDIQELDQAKEVQAMKSDESNIDQAIHVPKEQTTFQWIYRQI